jgi:hypothetical protein
MKYVRFISIVVILVLLIVVALSPGVVYAPTPRIVLYLLASVFLAALIGGEAASRFRMRLPGFLFVTGGASAIALGTLVLLTYLSKPEKQVLLFEVVDESGERVNLAVSGSLEFERDASGLMPTSFVSGNSVVLIFPEQLIEQKIVVRTSTGGKLFRGVVNYAKPPTAPLVLGKDLK